ncbi:MAG: hypothetical protein H6609_17110 [Ignavibacteriales bacterium]|nr:hypothetical protein [Ignavibacteriales bacterium]
MKKLILMFIVFYSTLFSQGILLKQEIISESGKVQKSDIITGYITINMMDNLIVIKANGGDVTMENIQWMDFDAKKWGVSDLTYAYVWLGNIKRDIYWSKTQGWLAHTAGGGRWLKYYYQVEPTTPLQKKEETLEEKYPEIPEGGRQLIYYMKDKEARDYYSKRYGVDYNVLSDVREEIKNEEKSSLSEKPKKVGPDLYFDWEIVNFDEVKALHGNDYEEGTSGKYRTLTWESKTGEVTKLLQYQFSESKVFKDAYVLQLVYFGDKLQNVYDEYVKVRDDINLLFSTPSSSLTSNQQNWNVDLSKKSSNGWAKMKNHFQQVTIFPPQKLPNEETYFVKFVWTY